MFTSKEFDLFRKDTEQALQEVAKKYNVDINATNIKYSTNNFKLTLEVNKKIVNGKSFEQSEFEKYCTLYGLKPEDYKKEFKVNNRSFFITGFRLRASKKPILAIDTEGKEYIFKEDTVKRLLAG